MAGLLLQGDKSVQLVVLCAEKPTLALLKRVSMELPTQLKKITEEHQYTVSMAIEESAVLVTDDTITVKVFLTSPLLRDPQGIYSQSFHVSPYHRFWPNQIQNSITKPMNSISSYQFQCCSRVACQSQPNGFFFMF